MTPEEINIRLEYLRNELREERISYSEIAELESLAPYISKYDLELLEAAGVPEWPEQEREYLQHIQKTAEECVLMSNWPHDDSCYQCGKARKEHK